LSEAARVIVIGDRESDIYGLFARRPAAVDLVVRAAQDRAVEDGSRLFAATGWPELGRMAVAVAPRGPGDKGRTARVAVKAGRVAWLAWIVARLGGWNCYYKPPGPKTMRDGWDKLAAATFGYLIGTASHV
jgi:hypothetical protein